MRSKPFFILTTLVLLGSSLISLYLASNVAARETIQPIEFKSSSSSFQNVTSSYIQALQQLLHGDNSYEPKVNLHEEKSIHQDLHQFDNNNPNSHLETEPDLDSDEKEYSLEDFADGYEFHHYLQWKQYLANVEELQGQLLAKKLLIEKNINTDAEDFHISQNPYKLLGLYGSMPAHYYNLSPKSKYHEGIMLYYGIIRNPQYCQEVDLYNLANQNNIFENLKFVSDQVYEEALIRTEVFPKFGLDSLPGMTGATTPEYHNKPIHMLPLNATTFFFKRINIHNHYEIGREMACHSQIYNHIPGNGVLTRKDFVAKHANEYMQLFKQKPHCIKDLYFPLTYQLNTTSQCLKFFEIINSQEYHGKKHQEPVQFLLKRGYGAHRAMGVFLFDQEAEIELRNTYQEGELCGQVHDNMLAQQYISNPLTLDKQNKFDFRIYMLVASVKPLVVYYHDGFLRLSLSKYDKFSKDKNVHLTNTHLSKEIFNQTTEQHLYQGMNEEELRDYQMWLMEDLQNYLLKTGKIQDENWLENSLRPMFKKAFIHLMRMTESSLYNVSNVFELFGLDFVLDENLNLWFIECNASPQLIASNDRKKTFLIKMLADLLEIQSAYYKSRMSRTFKFMEKMISKINSSPDTVDYSKFKAEFDSSIDINKLEPEFTVSSHNGFSLIIDKNIKGEGAYFGHLENECIHPN